MAQVIQQLYSTFFCKLAFLREFTFASVILRLLLAVLCGGLIGMERGRKRRPAGLRTYIIVCLGAALTMLLGQYESIMLATKWQAQLGGAAVQTDVCRISAQVINCIGFIGAGFYEAAIATTILLLFTELVVSKMEYRIFADSTKLNLYIECSGKDALENLLVYLKENMISLINFEIAGKTDDSANTMAAVFQLKLPRTTQRTNASVIGAIKEISGILSIVEM